MRNSLTRLYFSGVILTFLICACNEDQVPVIPDPISDPEQPILDAFLMEVSNVSICPGEKTQISLSNYDRKLLDFDDYNFYLSPEIGSLNLDSGYYQAPSSLDSEVFIELWAESKKDTSRKKGKVLRIHPNVLHSYILRNFNGITEAVDSKQLPDGSMIFASNTPTQPPGLAGHLTDFEIFCTDQKGNLLWKNKLGKGTLRRLYVGADAIYGLGHMNSAGFVVTKFDFKGNHLATKNLEIGVEMDFDILENLKGTFNDPGDFFIIYGAYPLTIVKLVRDMSLSTVNSFPYGEDAYSLDGSKFLITSKNLFFGFVVTDSELKILWQKSPEINVLGITRAIKSETGWEIWTIIREYSSNAVFLRKYDLSGNQIEDKKLSLNERLLINSLLDIVQLPNGTIWLVASSEIYPSAKPFLMDENFFYPFQLFQISKNGDILKESYVAKLNFTPPSFPGGWDLRYQGLFQGHDGMILTGQWYHNFVVQFNSDDKHSPCDF
jgi:hypothetical protein